MNLRYRAVVLMGDMFAGYGEWAPGKPLAFDEDLTSVVVVAEEVAEALEEVFVVGNRMRVDADGKAWSRDVRSVSVGDVVALTVGGRALGFHAVAPVGFTAVPADQWDDLILGSKPGRDALVALSAAREAA